MNLSRESILKKIEESIKTIDIPLSAPLSDKDIKKLKSIVKEEGYEFIRLDKFDWGMTIILIAKKDGEYYKLPIIQQFYDTDIEGNITKYHGCVDIRDTDRWKIGLPWNSDKWT